MRASILFTGWAEKMVQLQGSCVLGLLPSTHTAKPEAKQPLNRSHERAQTQNPDC